MKRSLTYLLRALFSITLITTIALASVAMVGCQKESKKKDISPEEMEKTRQQQMKMSQREMQNK